jgi:hypothetical protein
LPFALFDEALEGRLLDLGAGLEYIRLSAFEENQAAMAVLGMIVFI